MAAVFDGEAPIELYLSYSYLPLEQQSRILLAVSGMYRSLLALDRFGDPHRDLQVVSKRGEYYVFRDNLVAPPLCISMAQTGESIKLKFEPERRIFPRIVGVGEDIEVFVPTWTAAAFVAGAIFIGGMEGYGSYLDAVKTSYDIQKIQIEIEQLKSESVGTNKSPDMNSIYKKYNEFHYEINQPNIELAAINGVALKRAFSGSRGPVPPAPAAPAASA